MLKSIFVGTVLLAGLAACRTIQDVPVPQVEEKAAVEISDPSALATVQFDRVGVKVKRGTVIGLYEPYAMGLSGCYGRQGNIHWNSGRVLARDAEFADLFFNEMKSLNFNVVGDPDKMFASQSDNRRQASYLIGGQIEKIALNACREYNIWTGFPYDTITGKGAVTVRWQVFSTVDRKVVYETTTDGAAKLETGTTDGEMVIIHEAFAGAIRNLAADQGFVDLLSGSEPSFADIRKVDAAELTLDRIPLRTKAISTYIDNIRRSVVTVEGGLGHGSGFFISPTLVITNFHVVENRDLVRLRLITGRKVLGEVIRRHPKRDVAIIQVEASGHLPIPIRETPVKVTEEVYAIGSPLDKSLAGTVSKGIVSKFASNNQGLEDIQADVDIHGGNSGGVLLDRHGNAVGVSYAGIGTPDKMSVGLNFFIPIMDALEKLNLRLKSRAEPAS
ncbi:MAG: trypsin-like peptidase domain-containing protein [Rhodospirillales bacterium]